MTFEDEILAIVGTLPGTDLPSVSGRVHSSLKSARENFLQALTDGKLETPCAFVQFGIRMPDPTFGVEGLSERAPVLIAYYVDVSNTMQAEVTDALLTLRKTIDENDDAETFQSLEHGHIDASEENIAAEALLDARMNVFAGVLSYAHGLRVAVG